eukprot:Nk52_evm19s207 gene=Nk52_evmTU19s207
MQRVVSQLRPQPHRGLWSNSGINSPFGSVSARLRQQQTASVVDLRPGCYFSTTPQAQGPKCTLIIGPPGGGKGTLSGKVIKDFDFAHLSSGDILRSQIAQGTAVGKKAKSFVEAGDLVPDEVMVQLIVNELREKFHGENWILDGFPRTVQQALSVEKSFTINAVMHIDVPFEVIIDRIAQRWVHPGSGRIYNTEYHPPKVPGKDDETGEPLIQREDDKPEAVLFRLKKYEAITLPLLDFYKARGTLRTFAGTESDKIYPFLQDFLDNELRIPRREKS